MPSTPPGKSAVPTFTAADVPAVNRQDVFRSGERFWNPLDLIGLMPIYSINNTLMDERSFDDAAGKMAWLRSLHL